MEFNRTTGSKGQTSVPRGTTDTDRRAARGQSQLPATSPDISPSASVQPRPADAAEEPLARRSALPSGSRAAGTSKAPRVPRNDVERAVRIDELKSQLQNLNKQLENARDDRYKRLVYARFFKVLEEAISLYGQLTPAFRSRHPKEVMENLFTHLDGSFSCIKNWMILTNNAGNAETDPERLTPYIEELKEYKDFALSLHRNPDKYGSPQKHRKAQYESSISDTVIQTLGAHVNLAAAEVRLRAAQLDDVEVVEPTLESLQQVATLSMGGIDYQVKATHDSFADLLEGVSHSNLDESRRLKMCEQIWTGLERIGNAVDRFSLKMAGHENSVSWESGLKCVNAVSVLASAMSETMDVLFKHESATVGKDSTSSAEAAAKKDIWAVVLDKPSALQAQPESSSRRARRRSRPTRVAKAETEATSPKEQAVDNLKEFVLQRADDALKPGGLLTSSMAKSSADPLAIARMLKKDTSGIDRMEADGEDPLSIAKCLRTSAESWFGNIAVVTSAQRALTRLAEKNPDDASINGKLDALKDRIEALNVINRHLETREADSLKRHEFPKGSHLERLLTLKQIADVSPPRRLPADEPDNLFELQITPHPMSDASDAPSMYLHLHTSLPVTAKQCLKLKFGDFTARHVKNEEQKNLGPRWEQIQQKYGNTDARVHRGPVNTQVLDALLKMGSAKKASA